MLVESESHQRPFLHHLPLPAFPTMKILGSPTATLKEALAVHIKPMRLFMAYNGCSAVSNFPRISQKHHAYARYS